ncbi:hypothetical protein ACGF5F_33955 [Streptomyces sp. NPDC047821]|uniref:hypothetical protein n=1 Tax=unclassified Streptomyces TaxID=2593676 RepID=UPI00362E29AF
MRLTNRRLRYAIAPVAAATALTFLPSTAQAAEGARVAATDRGDACFPGACGSATFTWQDRDDVGGVSMSVRDTKCDSHAVYVRFDVDEGGRVWKTRERRNTSGCQAGYVAWHNLHIDNGGTTIRRLRVVVCVDDAGNDTCRTSRYFTNPYA